MKIDVPNSNLVEQNPIDKLWYGTREFVNLLKKLRDCSQSPRPQSGPSDQRPTRYIEKGLLFNDETLDRMIYVKSVDPLVWAYMDGTPV